MEKALRIVWLVVSSIFVVFVALALIVLIALTATLISDAARQPISFGGYFELLSRFSIFQTLTPADREVVVNITQPIFLSLSFFALVLPIVLNLKDRLDNERAIINCYKRSRTKNRRETARKLAKEFAHADDIWIVSGDFSWFCQDGDAGKEALNAILSRADRGAHHVNIATYKKRSDVEQGLQGIDAPSRAKFLALVHEKPHLKGMKSTIVNTNGYKTLYMISAASDGKAEQLVTIHDRDYGKKIINTFHDVMAV